MPDDVTAMYKTSKNKEINRDALQKKMWDGSV